MRQYVLPSPPGPDGILELSDGDSKYIARVLRKKEGEDFPGLDGEGKRWTLTVLSVDEGRVRLLALPDVVSATPQSEIPRITLFQGIPKAGKMDLIVRQATEAGIARVIPFSSEFAIGKIETQGDTGNKTARWNRVAREALQQSGSKTLTFVEAPIGFQDIPRHFLAASPNIGLFFHQEPLAHTSLHRYLSLDTGEIAILIGPEGGLSEKETALLSSWEWKPAYLGANVLRTETAAVYAAACVEIILLEKSSWTPKITP